MQSERSTIGPTGAEDRSLADSIKRWGHALGFSGIGLSRAEVAEATEASDNLRRWIDLERHGDMDYMAKHMQLRAKPGALWPGVVTVISASLPYWPQPGTPGNHADDVACISRYALGRDYHKTMRTRLKRLAEQIGQHLATTQPDTPFRYRVFSDSAPVMEVDFAVSAGIAWRGKHTLSLSRAGSWHFLGEIYTSLALPPDTPNAAHCGSCTRCLDTCPTGAIVAPYELDARLCISYLTIELRGSIPFELRPHIGNRIYGCDDCQLCCPWNRFAYVGDPDFAVRNGLDKAQLVDLFAWSAPEFEHRLAGSPIRRIGHERWLRNIAVALGNATPSPKITSALTQRADHPSALVREHVSWALARASR